MLPTILKTLEDRKASDIQVLDVQHLTPLMDTLVICTANVSRHAKSIANAVIHEAKIRGNLPAGVEGMSLSEWILIDLDSIVVHIMLSNERELYELEKLWGRVQ